MQGAWEEKGRGILYLQWQIKYEPNCKKSHEGPAPSMEPNEAMNTFARSEALHGLHCFGYVGDVDTKSYSSVVSSDPYPCKDITKKGCVAHVQKRMGSHLRKLQ